MRQVEIEIHKVKLVSGGDEGLEVDFSEDGLIKSKDGKECENPVHDDLKKAVQALAVHLAILTDYLPEKKSGDEDAVALFTVTGYSVRGSDEKRGFVITGYRATKRGGTVVLNSPFTRFEEDEATAYSLIGDVESKIGIIEDETKQYLFKGKQAPKKQLSLEMPAGEPVTNIKIAPPAGKDQADADAMQRVANLDHENEEHGDEEFAEIEKPSKPAKKKSAAKKSTGRKSK